MSGKTKTVIENKPYTANAILKISKISNVKSDNLVYEYMVGQYLNKLNKKHICFLETYGIYTFAHLNPLSKNTLIENFKLLTADDNSMLTTGCQSPNGIALLIQNFNGITLAEFLNIKLINRLSDAKKRTKPDMFNSLKTQLEENLIPLLNNELLNILCQVYLPLSELKETFTHYDLHHSNILIYEPYPDHYIEYH